MPGIHAAMHTDEVRIRLLGGLRVSVGGLLLAPLERWKRQAALLELLALAPGHALHREQIQEVLWPDLDGEAAANNLYGVLHYLRRLMQPRLERGSASRFLVLYANVLHLSAPLLWIDVEAFELAASSARCTSDPARYEAALALYSGDLLPCDILVDWIDSRRDVLHARFLALLHELAALYERRGQFEDAQRTLERLVSVDPANEDDTFRLMRLYAALGRRQLALHQYHVLRRALQRNLDCEPDARIEDLRTQIARSPLRSDRLDHAPLTRREHQISHLLTRGLTNGRIAAVLGMSQRTAETHVSRILRKLDVSSREQIAVVLGTTTDTYARSGAQLSPA